MLKEKEKINSNTLRLYKIKGLMAERDETQDDIAKLLNISRATINSRLKGKSDFKANEVARIAEHYSVPVGYFYIKT